MLKLDGTILHVLCPQVVYEYTTEWVELIVLMKDEGTTASVPDPDSGGCVFYISLLTVKWSMLTYFTILFTHRTPSQCLNFESNCSKDLLAISPQDLDGPRWRISCILHGGQVKRHFHRNQLVY